MTSATKVLESWIKSRPGPVQELAAEFPLLTKMMLPPPAPPGPAYWVIGYTEGDELVLSPIDPRVDWDRAMDERIRVCARHFRVSAAPASECEPQPSS